MSTERRTMPIRQMIDETIGFRYDFKSQLEMPKAVIYALYRTGYCKVITKGKRDQYPSTFEFQIKNDGSLSVSLERPPLKTIITNEGAIANIITEIDYKKHDFEVYYASSDEDIPNLSRINEVTKLFFQGYSLFDGETEKSYYQAGSKMRQWTFIDHPSREVSLLLNAMGSNNPDITIGSYQEAVSKVEEKMDEFYEKALIAQRLHREEIKPDWDIPDAMLNTGTGFKEAANVAARHNRDNGENVTVPTGR